MERKKDSNIPFYYHDYHRPLEDRLPTKTYSHGEQNYDEIPYTTQYVRMFEFIEFYVPWSSFTGAIVFLCSYLSVLCTWQMVIYYRVNADGDRRFLRSRSVVLTASKTGVGIAKAKVQKNNRTMIVLPQLFATT